ncbi:MAG: CopG family transcriptional regulator [Gammaproteobacteria bacterium]|nr:MAG: CopG family transcriptional regulator [Gammaproteobacteria bacterium]
MATAVQLDNKLESRIQHLADARRCSPHQLINEAIRDYVEREEKRASFKQDALRAWEAYQENGLHLTLEEADAWLAKLEAGQDVEIPKCHT